MRYGPMPSAPNAVLGSVGGGVGTGVALGLLGSVGRDAADEVVAVVLREVVGVPLGGGVPVPQPARVSAPAAPRGASSRQSAVAFPVTLATMSAAHPPSYPRRWISSRAGFAGARYHRNRRV